MQAGSKKIAGRGLTRGQTRGQTRGNTGTVIDGGARSAVARALTWERYDALLQTEPDDDFLLIEINREVAGPRFAIITADVGTPFSGDAASRLKVDRLVPAKSDRPPVP